MRREFLAILPVLVLVAETDFQDAMNTTMIIVASVLPLLVLVLILKLLFRSFGEISKINAVKIRLAKILPMLILVGETAWDTNMDIWGTITGIVLLVLPFLVLIIVLRSIFRYFTREW